MQRRQLLRAGAASAAVLAAPMIKAQSLPSGPIRIVVGFPPGGGTDALARVLAQNSKRCGTSISLSTTKQVRQV